MNEIELEKLIEASWRRKLTAEEEVALQSYLATQRDSGRKWEEELRLSELLGSLPHPQVSSNFTARVLQAVERDKAQSPARPGKRFFHWLKLSWVPRAAVTCALIFAAAFSNHQHRATKRAEIANAVAAVSQAATVPQEWLQDFEAINRLSQPPVDEVLLAALQ